MASSDSRDMQWCYWRGELVQAFGPNDLGYRAFIVHGSHWYSSAAWNLVDEEEAINGEAPIYGDTAVAARTMMKKILKDAGLTKEATR